MSEDFDQTPAPKSFWNKPVKGTLPFSRWWPIFSGAIVGILIRFVFSEEPGQSYSAMRAVFIIFSPLAVAAVTVYLAETKARRSWRYYMAAGAFANMLFVFGTLLIMIEGLICAIIILPLFGLIGALSGLLMGAICRVTKWPKQAVYSFVLLPLVLGVLPPEESHQQRYEVTERSVLIATEPAKIWQQLLHVENIKEEEVGQAWMYRIGVPLPIEGIAQATPEGLVRKVTMGKSIHFDQVATDWEKDRYVKWQYRFDKNSFPPNALDEHVKIGGHYFDIIDTVYTLTPITPQTTRLRIQMRYRVSTEFNWYALPVAHYLIGNFEEVILQFYEHRALATTG